MRKWFGVLVLGTVAFVVGMLGNTAVTNGGPYDTWPPVIAELVLLIAWIAGAVAILVGLIGIGVAALRPQRGRRAS